MLITNPSFKLIICLIIISFLVFYPLQITKAASGWLIVTKEFVLDLIARVIGRILMSIMSNTVVNKILTSGRENNTPAFVQDWRDFLGKAQYRGEDQTRATIADAAIGSNATICPYLRNPLTTAFGAGSILPGFNAFKYRIDSLQYFNQRNKCTLPAGFNVNTFRNDFSAGGGWAAWDKLIQPQNNFYGVYNDSLTELSRQRGFEEGIDKSEAESGSGYTSKRTGCSGSGANQQCTILGKVITPADLFGKSGAQTIDAEFSWLFSSDEIQEALISLAGVVASRLTSFVSGALLNDSGSTVEPPPPADAVQRAAQDCVDVCIAACPPPLDSCIYNTDEFGNEYVANHPCAPLDQDPRDACVSTCQAQGCN